MNSLVQWREISDLPGYMVSNTGLIKCMLTGKLIPLCKTNNGYLKTNIFVNGLRYSKLIHRVVLSEFAGPSDLQVNHIDGNKENNCLNNLEYTTQSENIRHGFSLGLYTRKGEQNPASKLKLSQVKEIRRLLKLKIYTQQQIGEMFGVAKSTISKINMGRKWKE